MKLTKIFSLIALVLSVITFAQKNSKQDISMYPKAENGYVQKVITLKPVSKENNYVVELFVGKLTSVDTCNNFFLTGNLEEKNVDGWGYNYYQFDTNGIIGGTLMGCPDNKKENRIVYAQTIKARYNSKLPIVVYVPVGYSLEYRIWKANDKLITVQ